MAILAALSFGVVATGAVRLQDFLVLEGLVLVAAAVYVLRLVVEPDQRLVWAPAVWLVLAFAVYAWVRAGLADLSYPAAQELRRVVVYALVFVVALNHLKRQKDVTAVVYVLAALGLLASGYAVYQFLAKSDHVLWYVRPATYAGRGSGPFICPNSLAGFLAAVLPLVLALAIGGRTGAAARIGLAYASLVMLTGLAVSLSRGGWAAAAAGISALAFLHLWLRQHVKRVVLVLAVLLLVGSVGAGRSYVIRHRVQATVDSYHVGDSVELRLSLWRSAWWMWRDHFWWGVGPGHFDHRFPGYRETSVQARPMYAHNDYLNTLADWGVVGAGLLVGIFALTFYAGWQVLRSSRRRRNDLERSQASDRWSVVAGGVSGLVALLAHSAADFDMQIPAIAVAVALILALINSHSRHLSGRYSVRMNLAGRLGVAGVLAALIAWLGIDGIQAGREARALGRAAKETHLTPTKIEALRSALVVRPDNFEVRYALAEGYRQISWQGEAGYETNALEAIAQYRLAQDFNPFDPYYPARLGMCLDWLGRHAEATPYYERAQALDPNNYYLSILRGWHHLQVSEYVVAQRWFLRSLQQKYWPNPEARRFLSRARRLSLEQTDQGQRPEGPPPR